MKSGSGSAPRVDRWRLRRTLRRRVDYRPIEAEDVRYLWVAYKQGALAPLGDSFADGSMDAAAFHRAITDAVEGGCHAAWTLLGPTRKGFIPTGFVFAAWSPLRCFLIVIGAVWMPWAKKRNIVECMVGFLNRVRKEFPLQFYAIPEHKRLYEVCAMHGIVRRIGTSYVALPGKACAIFETRTS